MRALELEIAKRATSVWALTDDDASALRALGATVRVFPVPGRRPGTVPDAARSGIRLIGNWTWQPNAAGLHWFCENVVPLLPVDVEVEVAGGGAEWLTGDGRVTYRGRIDDPETFLAGARVVAIPAVAGAGIQVKTLDAIAAGAWIVATPLALRGVADPPGSVTVAAEPAAFAGELRSLLEADATLAPADAGVAWAERRRGAFAAQVAHELDSLRT
jgi:hypothetical protein